MLTRYTSKQLSKSDQTLHCHKLQQNKEAIIKALGLKIEDHVNIMHIQPVPYGKQVNKK